jgi:hypothetical protein
VKEIETMATTRPTGSKPASKPQQPRSRERAPKPPISRGTPWEIVGAIGAGVGAVREGETGAGAAFKVVELPDPKTGSGGKV